MTISKNELETVRLKRVYDPVASSDGTRLLVERLWPRGIKKTALKLDAWLKEVAPTTSLRQWFSHDPTRWQQFRRRYFAELRQNPEAVAPIIDAAQRGAVTLLYSAHDREHNNAVALREYVEGQVKKKTKSR